MIPRKDLADVLLRLRELLASGATLTKAAEALGLKLTYVYKLAKRKRLLCRRRALPASTRRKVERDIVAAKLTLSEIAKRLQVSKSTVCRHRQRLLDEQAGTTFRPRRVKRAIRCPNGHLTTFSPCVECAAAAGETQ